METKQVNIAGGQQVRTAKASKPLEDGDKVAEIKKILTDFTKGKIELSDLPKAMAGVSGGTGNVTPPEGGRDARSGTVKSLL